MKELTHGKFDYLPVCSADSQSVYYMNADTKLAKVSIDGAAQDVQSAISAAARQLPTQMPSPPTMRKVNPSDQPIMYLAMGSSTLQLSEVDKYAEMLLARQLSTLSGK